MNSNNLSGQQLEHTGLLNLCWSHRKVLRNTRVGAGSRILRQGRRPIMRDVNPKLSQNVPQKFNLRNFILGRGRIQFCLQMHHWGGQICVLLKATGFIFPFEKIINKILLVSSWHLNVKLTLNCSEYSVQYTKAEQFIFFWKQFIMNNLQGVFSTSPDSNSDLFLSAWNNKTHHPLRLPQVALFKASVISSRCDSVFFKRASCRFAVTFFLGPI